MDHLSNGVYFVDTRSDIRVFSMSALLRMQLHIHGVPSTKIEIFPSEYFIYDTALGDKLEQVDVFRVGQLATLSIANPFVSEGFEQIFGADANVSQDIFDEYQKYYKNRQEEIQKVILKFQPLASNGLSKMDEF